MAADTGTKKKSDKLAVNLPSLDEQIDRFTEATAEMKQQKAIAETAGQQIISEVSEQRFQLCRKEGRAESSVRVNGRVTFTQKCQYSPVPGEALPELEAAFGAEFGRYFPNVLSIKLNAAAASDEATLESLIGAIGADKFQEWFEIERKVLPSEMFHTDMTMRPEVQATAQPFIDMGVIKPYKPTIR